jgi:hypothetical protein
LPTTTCKAPRHVHPLTEALAPLGKPLDEDTAELAGTELMELEAATEDAAAEEWAAVLDATSEEGAAVLESALEEACGMLVGFKVPSHGE